MCMSAQNNTIIEVPFARFSLPIGSHLGYTWSVLRYFFEENLLIYVNLHLIDFLLMIRLVEIVLAV